jgi:hypothetical protein
VVEFVDDEHVPVIRGLFVSVERLHAGKNMLPVARPLASDEELAEGPIAEHGAVGAQCLNKDFFSVSHE